MMDQPAQILDQQLDFLDCQADPEKWQHDHELAMICCEIEDLIALALETIERIRKRRGSLPEDVLLGYFRRWHEISLRALVCIERIEGSGYRPERADEFRFAVNESSIAADKDRVKAALDRLAAGHGRHLDEIVDGISTQA